MISPVRRGTSVRFIKNKDKIRQCRGKPKYKEGTAKHNRQNRRKMAILPLNQPHGSFQKSVEKSKDFNDAIEQYKNIKDIKSKYDIKV